MYGGIRQVSQGKGGCLEWIFGNPGNIPPERVAKIYLSESSVLPELLILKAKQ